MNKTPKVEKKVEKPEKKEKKKVEKTEPKVEKTEPKVEKTEPKVETVEKTETPDLDPISSVLQQLFTMKTTIASLIDEVKKIQKGSKKKARTGNQKSGFVKQVPISEDLSTFMGLKQDELVSRVDVTKYLTEYVKTNNLQVPENKQLFKVDEKLAKLFSMDQGEQIHYFKLQTHLKSHYPKQEVVA